MELVQDALKPKNGRPGLIKTNNIYLSITYKVLM